MNILVTGASGFIGGRIVQFLTNNGHKVHCLLRSALSRDQQVALGVGESGTAIAHVGRLDDSAFLDRCCTGIDVIIHCAGKAGTWGSRKSYIDANVAFTRRLANAAKRQQVPKWIQLSSPSVYFEFRDHLNIDEDFVPSRFSSFYAESKYAADRALFDEFGDAFATIALRPRFVLGAGDQQIVPRIQRFLKYGFFPLVGGDQKIDVTNVTNICRAIECCLQAEGHAWGQVYNISNGAPITFRELISDVQQTTNSAARIVSVPQKLVRYAADGFAMVEHRTGAYWPGLLHPVEVGVMTHSMTLSLAKARDQLGFVPDADFRHAIAEYTVPSR